VPYDHVHHVLPTAAASGVYGSAGGTGRDAVAGTVTVPR